LENLDDYDECDNDLDICYILPVVLYRREIWSLTLREEHRLMVFENRVLRGRKWLEAGENCIMRGFITCAVH
jgi:hypothetical protein